MHFDAINQFQSKLYQALQSDLALRTQIGDAIFDGAPVIMPESDVYVQIGDGQMRESGAQNYEARDWFFDIFVYAKNGAFHKLLPVANSIQKRLLEYDFDDSSLLSLRFLRASTQRLDQGALKRISQQFKANFSLKEEV